MTLPRAATAGGGAGGWPPNPIQELGVKAFSWRIAAKSFVGWLKP